MRYKIPNRFECRKCGKKNGITININRTEKTALILCMCGVNKIIENVPSIYDKIDVYGNYLDSLIVKKKSKIETFDDLEKGFLEY